MYRSRLSALATIAMVGCSVLLAEEPAQCTSNADCAELGFTGSTCDASGVCVAPVNGGSGGGGGTTTAGTSGSTSDGGTAGTSVANGGEGNSTAGTGTAGAPPDGDAGMGGSLGGGGSGSSPPTTPSAVRPIGDSLTQTAGGAALAYLDTCPEDQVLIGINGWAQADASPSWLMRGQAVCGKIVLTHGTPGGGVAGAGGAPGAAGAGGAADGPLTVTIEAGAVLYERGNGLIDDVQSAAMCDPNEVVVGFDGRSGAFMDRVRVYCAPLVVTGGPGTYALEFGDLPTPRGSVGASAGGGAFSLLACPPGQIARGAQIQAGAYLDAFGLVCGKPELAYPVGAACTSDGDCDTANCDTDFCAAVTCGELTGAGGEGGSAGISVNCTCALLDIRQYLFCDGSPTWTEAIDACSDRGMQLVRVNEGSENGWLRSTASLRALGSFWLGATDAVTEGDWLWSDGTMFWQGPWDTGGPVGGLYNLWSGAQPDNASTLEHCAEMYPDSRWNDNTCVQMRDFVCEPL